MIVPDVNLLLYAYDATNPFHLQGAKWWSECLSGDEPVGLPSVVLFGYLRISTNRKIFQNPLTVTEAGQHIESWLLQPNAQLLETGPKHVQQTLALLNDLGSAGNLVTDAQIASLAIANQAIVHTADADFSRFRDVLWFNPLTGDRNKPVSKKRRPR